MKKNNSPQSTSSLDAWLSYIESIHSKTVDMKLDRISQVAMRLDLLKPAPFIFTVAGTNGKGTTCCILEKILMESNYRVGVYSSPHLTRYTERVRIQNSELLESMHTASFAEIEDARGDIPLTYFEYSTLTALWLFKQAKLNIVILEVGLGGRMDATNIVDSDVAIITSIALDHTELLGSNRENIGREKAGIFRSGKPAVVGELDMPFTITEVAKAKGTHLLCHGIHWQSIVVDGSSCWHFVDQWGRLDNLPLPKIPQPNAATALAALRASGLTVSKKAIYNGIRNAFLPGRFQIINEAPRIILDVAHNPHAATYLVKRLATLSKNGRILAVIGMLQDKDISGMISCMKSMVDRWYCASIDGPRGASAEQLMKYIKSGTAYASVEHAWQAAIIDAKLSDTVLVCGSFYTVEHVMDVLNMERTIVK